MMFNIFIITICIAIIIITVSAVIHFFILPDYLKYKELKIDYSILYNIQALLEKIDTLNNLIGNSVREYCDIDKAKKHAMELSDSIAKFLIYPFYNKGENEE